jgi:hypothetical protein
METNVPILIQPRMSGRGVGRAGAKLPTPSLAELKEQKEKEALKALEKASKKPRQGGPGRFVPRQEGKLFKAISKMKYGEYQRMWNKALYEIYKTKPAGSERTAFKKQLKQKYGIQPLPILKISGVGDTFLSAGQVAWQRLLTTLGMTTQTARQAGITQDTLIENISLIQENQLEQNLRNLRQAGLESSIDPDTIELYRFIDDAIGAPPQAPPAPPPAPPQAPPPEEKKSLSPASSPEVKSSREVVGNSSWLISRRKAMRGVLRALSTGVRGGMSKDIDNAVKKMYRNESKNLDRMINYLHSQGLSLSENSESIRTPETKKTLKALRNNPVIYGGLNHIIQNMGMFTNKFTKDESEAKLLKSAYNRYGIPEKVANDIETEMKERGKTQEQTEGIFDSISNTMRQMANNTIVRSVATNAITSLLQSQLGDTIGGTLAELIIDMIPPATPQRSPPSITPTPATSPRAPPRASPRAPQTPARASPARAPRAPLIRERAPPSRASPSRERAIQENELRQIVIEDITDSEPEEDEPLLRRRRPLAEPDPGDPDDDPVGGDDIENQLPRRRIRFPNGETAVITAITASAVIAQLIATFGFNNAKKTKLYNDLLPYTDEPTDEPADEPTDEPTDQPPPPPQDTPLPPPDKTEEHTTSKGDFTPLSDPGIGLHRAEELIGGEAHLLLSTLKEQEQEEQDYLSVFGRIPEGHGAPKKEQSLYKHNIMNELRDMAN